MQSPPHCTGTVATHQLYSGVAEVLYCFPRYRMSSEGDAGVKRRPNMADDPSKSSQSGATPSSGVAGVLSKMDSRWKNWWIRGIFSFVMVGGFSLIIYLGPIPLSLLVLAILLKCFQEIISIGYSKYKEYNLPLYRVLNWYFLFVATFFLYGDNFYYYHPEYKNYSSVVALLAQYHRIISFFLYVGGFVLFVMTLKAGLYQTQFGMFGWTHITLFMLGSQAYLIMQNIFEALFWFLLPISMVICNDIFAYLFGFFFGRTRLIKLSPKKTWEGFLGAFVSTVIYGFIFSYILAKYDFFVCYNQSIESCERSYMFVMQEYNVLGLSIHLYPAQLHSFPLSVFASLIAPFGGFFASGFKRAFNIKDFDDLIPGHGGIMDRFDCQILMATFANVYYFTFARDPSADYILAMILALPAEKQTAILSKLQQQFASNT